jgi:hypothetical protein
MQCLISEKHLTHPRWRYHTSSLKLSSYGLRAELLSLHVNVSQRLYSASSGIVLSLCDPTAGSLISQNSGVSEVIPEVCSLLLTLVFYNHMKVSNLLNWEHFTIIKKGIFKLFN